MTEKLLVAHQNMKEFDPECEQHFALLIVKAVEPGCTTEIQIEEAISGKVHRLTTTDDERADMTAFEVALVRAFRSAWKSYGDKK